MSSLKIMFSALLSLFILSAGGHAKSPQKTGSPHTVMVVLDALPGKESELEAALQDVVAPSRSEASCLEYRLHKSIENPAQFMLFENWVSKEKHAEQFDKPYIKVLGAKLEGLLANPYLVVMAADISQ